ncbi:MAG: hypothetical protein RIQ47_140 [Bacteroidota bacterium]|jgi:hypothetical protein
MKKLLSLLFLIIGVSSTAQYVNNPTTNTTVSDVAPFEEAVPIIGLDQGAYNTIVTYFNQNASGTYDFSMQVLDYAGTRSFAPNGQTVSSYPQSTAVFKYDTKVAPDNSIVTAFQDERSGVLDVVAYRMSASGSFLWGPAGIPLTDPAGSGIGPSVGIMSNGDAVIAWQVDGSPKDWISFQRITLGGNTYWPSAPKRIIDSTFTVGFIAPQVVPMDNGEFMIFYYRAVGNFGLPVCTMYMQRFDINGNPVWAQPVRLSSKNVPFFSFPSVISDGSNGAYIAYTSGNPTNPAYNEVYVQHIDASGNLWNVDGTNACSGATTQRMSPKIRYTSSMPYPIVVMKETDGSQVSAGVTIQSFDTVTGVAQWLPDGVSVTPITAAYDEPYDMQELCGNMVILYAEGPVGNNTMYATKVDYNGVPQWSTPSIALSTVASNKSRGQLTTQHLVSTLNPQVVAVWEDERNDRGIYAQNISCDGTMGPLSSGISESVKPTWATSVYPNPAVKYVRVYAERNEKVNMFLTDATGRTVAQRNALWLVSGMNEYSLSGLLQGGTLSSGVYTLTIRGDRAEEQVRVVVE